MAVAPCLHCVPLTGHQNGFDHQALLSVFRTSASVTDLYLQSPIDMSSALHKSGEFSSEESCSLMAGTEDNVPKILHRQKHHARAFHGFQLNFFQLNFCWAFTTCVLLICLFATMRRGHSQCQDQYTYENGYDTEFGEHRDSFFFLICISVAVTPSPRQTGTPF